MRDDSRNVSRMARGGPALRLPAQLLTHRYLPSTPTVGNGVLLISPGNHSSALPLNG
jgi:hypothetical protein